MLLQRQETVWITLGAIMMWQGYKRKSLTFNAAVVGWILGVLHSLAGNYYILTMVAMYAYGTIATRYNKQRKAQFESTDGETSGRTVTQVLCIAGVPALLSLYQVYMQHPVPGLCEAFTAIYACNLGDTIASEIGMLSQGDPYSIWTMRRVPRGTNGAISVLGCVACLLSALLLNFTTRYYAPSEMLGIHISAAKVGMLLDAVLGATLQATYIHVESCKICKHPGQGIRRTQGVPLLSNEAVNLVSSLLTGLITFLLMRYNQNFNWLPFTI
ncbi:hypothetical protein MP228_007845 [Amoeboaphelidium protococcarum]|nr:hypothetical protein MP228_007845 [Amoeboaphelidium protococcarum]